jgi:P-type Ca2+ transporter type 2C
MITGDHAETGLAIGSQVHIAASDTPPLTGAEIERLDDAALRTRVAQVAIYARAAPEHKLRIVRERCRRAERWSPSRAMASTTRRP